MEKRPRGFQKGHPKHGGARKGVKAEKEDSLTKDIYWVYKKLGGKNALLDWAQNPKNSNDEFWKMFKGVTANKKGGNGNDSPKFIEDLKK